MWRSNVRKEYPVPPNLLKNTRFWLWPNEVVDANNPFGSNENVWVENSLPLYWGWYNYADANGVVGDTTFRAKTIHVENQTAWVAEGLPDPSQIPLLNTSPPSGLNTHTYGGRYSRTLVLEITKTKGRTTFLDQDCAVYTSWNRGDVWLTTKIYFAILSRTGNITLKFMGNRFPSVDIGPQEQGRWHHATAHRYGFRGCIQGFVVGSGTIKVALMFPYVGVGYIPEDADVWAGYVGSESAAYTHEDLVVSNNALAKGGM